MAAVVVLNTEAQIGWSGTPWGVLAIRRAVKDRLARYKVPQELKVVEGGLPRNAMGKGQHNCPSSRNSTNH